MGCSLTASYDSFLRYVLSLTEHVYTFATIVNKKKTLKMLLFQAACVTITLLVGIRCGVPTTTLTPFTNPSPTTYLYYLPTYLTYLPRSFRQLVSPSPYWLGLGVGSLPPQHFDPLKL